MQAFGSLVEPLWATLRHYLSESQRFFQNRLEASSLRGPFKSLSDACPYGVPYQYKNLDSAAMVLFIARAHEPRLSCGNETARKFYSQLNDLMLFFLEYNKNKSARDNVFDDRKVIVLEGFSGSGKTSLSCGMASKFDKTSELRMHSFHAEIRQVFESMPVAVSQAFDFVICYFMARDIIERQAPGGIVVAERYYHYVCARASCLDKQKDPRTLPEPGYYWPCDLPKPHLVLFLAMSESQLRERWDAVVPHPDDDEERLKYLEIAYSFVEGPPIVAVDASLPKLSLLCLVEDILVHHCQMNIPLREMSVYTEHEGTEEGSEERGRCIDQEQGALRGDNYDDIFDSQSANNQREEEQIILEDSFDANDLNTGDKKTADGSKRGKMLSRRSSLGVFGVFSELKMEW